MRFGALLLAMGLPAGCGTEGGSVRSVAAGTTPALGGGTEWFSERAREAGLTFVHFNGMSGEFYYPEVIAPGVGVIDFDGDGDLDVYLVQGRMLVPSKGPAPLGGRLYRNDLSAAADGTRTVRFTDVTGASGVTAREYGMGVAVADFNNDGCADLYLTNLGPNQLFRNNCDGTFTDVSKQSRTDDPGWSVSASFLDFDRDGWLDLFVGHYVSYTVDTNIRCFMLAGGPNYCPPQVYRAQPSRLYHNNRDGTFSDATASSGLAVEFGPALGVSTADFNNDGWMDVYVANDGRENQLWINKHDGTFENAALLAGVALPVSGKAEASMGVDAGDFDDDGDEDLFVTELTSEGSNLYVNDGTGVFDDRSTPSGLSAPSVPFTGFGTAWFDFDNDGHLDLLSVNGTVQIIETLRQAKDPLPLHQRKLLFHSLGGGRFEEVGERAGEVFKLSEVGRGAAFGDVDNDGDVDVLIGNNNGPTRLLINQAANGRHWIGLRLVGVGGRDMVGARVEITRKGAASRWRRARADGSYASANDPRVVVGLGESSDRPDVRVTWPDGKVDTWTQVAVDTYTTLRQKQ
jgi:hypothetical protein